LTRIFLREVFAAADVLIAPVIPEPAPPIAHAVDGAVDELARRQGRYSRLTRPFNAFGLPALTVPCGLSGSGLPLGSQVVGRPFAEASVLRVGRAYEREAGWHQQRPPPDLSTPYRPRHPDCVERVRGVRRGP